MTEERVGGISIEASITDERVDAELNALLAKIKAFAEQATAAATVHVNISGTQQAQQQPTQQQRQQREAQPPPISYGAGSATRAAAQQGQTSQVRMINAELAKTGEFFNAQTGQVEKLNAELATTRRTMGSVTRDARTQQAELTQGIADVEPINVTVNTTEAKEQLASFLAEFKTTIAEAQAGATVTVRTEGQAGATTGGRGRGGGRGRAAARAAADGDEDEAPNIRYNRHGAPILEFPSGEDMGSTNVSRTRRGLNRYGVQPLRIVGDESLGSSIQAQRSAERDEARRARETARQAARDADAARAAQRAKDQADLQGLSDEMAAQNRGYQPSSTFAPPREERRTAAPEGRQGVFVGTPFTGTDEARSREEWLRGWRSSARGQRPLTPENEPPETGAQQRAREAAAGAALPPVQPYRTPDERARRARQDREVRNRQQDEDAQTSAAFAASARVRQREVDEQQVSRVTASRRAAIAAGGQTGRTAAFGLGALFGGNRGAQIQAQEEASQALRQLRGAESAIKPLDDRLKDIARSWSVSTGANRAFNREQFLAIRRSDEYRQALGNVRSALEQDAAAQEKLNKFTAPTSIARNLLAGAAGGAAYGLALSAAAQGFKAIEAAAAPTVERLTGFAAVTAAYTSNLADATRAAHGNAASIVDIKMASTGLSAATIATIQPIIQQRVQLEAGNKAIQDQIDTFRVSENLRKAQGGAGVTSGTGGALGTSLGQIPGVDEQFGNFLQQLGDTQRGQLQGSPLKLAPNANTGILPRDLAQFALSNPLTDALGINKGAPDIAGATEQFGRGLAFVNAQLVKGGDNADKFAQDLTKANPNIERTAQAFESIGAGKLAQQTRDLGLFIDNIANIPDPLNQANAALRAATALNTGAQRPDLATLAQTNLDNERQRQLEAAQTLPALQSQFARERPAFLAGLERQQQFQLDKQLPARAALGALASPLLAPGTGQVAANADEQERIEASTARTQKLQDQLNAYYKQGEQVLRDTYQIPQDALDDIRATGQAITGIQKQISDKQATYQTAQYNYQLTIAKRTLSDIGGLTGRNFGAGQSYLGVLEKQNLALSRQGQLLQFQLAQRQINFQVALAGFQAPGVTPEERQANVKEAEIEASFAQKQLDIQRKMFGNQVQIVDTQNLRQGVDLANQIALLLQGRKVTIDIAALQEQQVALGKIQDEQVQKAGTYVEKVDKAVGRAFSEIQALETAAGEAMFNAATYAAGAFGVFLGGTIKELNAYKAQTQSVYGRTGTGGTGPTSQSGAASGAMFNTGGGPVGMMTIGENDRNETVFVLRNPRAGSLGGGMVNIFNITGDVTVRNADDIDEMARKVTRVIGNTGALKGLRSGS